MQTDSPYITLGIIGCVLVLINIVFLVVILFIRRRMNQVSRWSSTMGAVLSSTTEWRSSGEGSAEYPVVQYTYQVQGRTYQGVKITPGPEVGGTGARKVVARYPAGAQVMVFYDPQNPSDAVLEKKAAALWVMWLVLGILDCLFVAALTAVWFVLDL